MSHKHPAELDDKSNRWFGLPVDDLPEVQRRVLLQAANRKTLARDLSIDETPLTFGQRLADRVAEFGGSWTFIMSFGAVLLTWTMVNLALLNHAFDPYPFIFLNLLLSMVAAVQAPLIMMSQNRQAAKDRQAAAHDYEVNLKAEIEIMALHEKLDQMRTEQITTLLKAQETQIEMLTQLLAKQGKVT